MSILELLAGTGIYIICLVGIGGSWYAGRQVTMATGRTGMATSIVGVLLALVVTSALHLGFVLYTPATPTGLKNGGMLGLGSLGVLGAVLFLLWRFVGDVAAYTSAK